MAEQRSAIGPTRSPKAAGPARRLTRKFRPQVAGGMSGYNPLKRLTPGPTSKGPFRPDAVIRPGAIEDRRTPPVGRHLRGQRKAPRVNLGYGGEQQVKAAAPRASASTQSSQGPGPNPNPMARKKANARARFLRT